MVARSLTAFVCLCGFTLGQNSVASSPLVNLKQMITQVSADHPVPQVTYSDWLKLKSKGAAYLVDVRKVPEQDVSMVSGSMTLEAFQKIEDTLDKNSVVVIMICTIGVRSGELTSKYKKAGWNAYNYIGGVLAWAHAGGVFVDSKGKATKRVHTYGEEWAKGLPESHESVIEWPWLQGLFK